MNTNVVVLTGRLTKDVELKYTQSGKAVTNFTLAVDDGFGDKKKAYFFNCVLWEKGAETLANYTHKGSKIAVTGKLSSRNYEANDGSKRTVVEVQVNQFGGFELLDSKKDNDQRPAQNNLYRTDERTVDVSDDDLPF